MSRTNYKAKGKGKTPEKSPKLAKPKTPGMARKNVLGCISKPPKKSVRLPALSYVLLLTNLEPKSQKTFFKDFLARLEGRDEKLEKSDMEVSNQLCCSPH